jgi:hypothetical protein
MPPSELELSLRAVGTAADLPAELPVAHLTTARWLTSILEAGELVPRSCRVFHRDLVYFSYGGVFYRTSKMQSENAAELPVAMVFSPEVLDVCTRLFPFDSGAMADKLFGEAWYTAMEPFEDRFSITGGDLSMAARLLVLNLYHTNQKYIGGRPVRSAPAGAPALQLLHGFLSTNQSNNLSVFGGVDHRQRSIEALTTASVSLAKHLVWIGMPHSRYAKTMKAIKRHTRRVPQAYAYHPSRNFSPDTWAADLERQAYEDIVERYAK